MANEYLKRTPTSSGNRKIFTYAGWFKKNNANGSDRFDIFNAYNTGSQAEEIGFRQDALRYLSSGSTLYGFDTTNKYRDTGNWFHIVFALNTTLESQRKRSVIYINGVEVDTTTSSGIGAYVAKNFDSIAFNVAGKEHNVLARKYSSSGRDYVEGQAFDIFFVDGQALTPDVFGFYKDGDGYISVGSTQSTDFRPGQWTPHSPTKIKKDINRRGGFGVNGFYLPMNDSSNPGADFHCAPNSIIKLKGEDLPQPRNGAPTTSDAFVSQLRQETGTLGFDGAVKFDGDGDYLSLSTTSDFAFGTGNFTIEFWAWIESSQSSTLQPIFDNDYNSAGGLAIAIRHSDSRIFVGDNGSGLNLCQFNAPFALNSWNHFAVVADSGTYKAFVNGTSCSLGLGSATVVNTSRSSGTTEIGRLVGQTSLDAAAFISNLRVVKGTALYTANFTPPTEPLTNVTNTKLLCCNSSTSATAATVTPGTITAVGGAFATRNELTGSIVLAVPGILDDTNNLITNGSFDSNINNWTVNGTGAAAIVSSGQAQLTNGGTNVSSLDQTITTVVGRSYLVTALITPQGGGPMPRLYAAGSFGQVASNANVQQLVSVIRTATSTSTIISVNSNTNVNNAVTLLDDVKVFDLNPVDYSADIRGSGTNKTVQATLGTGGIGYELGGYYGSAINASDNNCGHAFSGADSAFVCPGDFTVELWLDPVVATQPQSNPRILGQTNNSGGKWDIYIDSNTTTNRIYTMGGSVALTGGNGSNYGNFVPGQWNHFCLERSGSTMTTYMNGVAVYTQTYTNTIGTTDFLYLGSYGDQSAAPGYGITGKIQDFRFYKGLAKYKGGFDVSKPYTPVGIEAFRTTADTCKNNFATLNSLDTSQLSATNGNLSIDQSSGGWHSLLGTHYVRSGKWYAEMRIDRLGWIFFGVEQTWLLTRTKHVGGQTGSKGAGLVYNTGNRGDITYNGTNSAYTGGDATAATGDIISIALDLDSNNVKFYKNNVLQYNLNNILESGADYTFGVSPYSNVAVTVNFGQNPSFSGTVTAGTNADGNGKGLFKYAPPTGFLALCEDNLPTPAIADPGKHFKTVLYTGDGTNGHSITGVGFKPDFVWVKCRNTSKWHALVDSVRGNTKTLHSNSANAEGTETHVSSFDNNGFTVADIDSGTANENGFTYVAWCWKAGGAAASNSDGSITSQVSANQDAGFSIVSYTGNNTAGATIGHGLGKKPSMMIVKERTGASGWFVYHKDLGATKFLSLHDVTAAGTETGNTACWYATEPNTSVFTVGQNGATNENNRPIIAYCWTEIEGYSKFGSYIGNNSADGPFAYCGFKPAWVLIKKTNGSGDENWRLFDSSRCSTNQNNKHLLPSNPAAESTETGMDFLSNGFKLRHTDAHQNQNETTYIFAAFAESPFQTANAK